MCCLACMGRVPGGGWGRLWTGALEITLRTCLSIFFYGLSFAFAMCGGRHVVQNVDAWGGGGGGGSEVAFAELLFPWACSSLPASSKLNVNLPAQLFTRPHRTDK